MSTSIILIGLSGTGKSTAGSLLAQALGRRFIDTDALIEERSGRLVPDIFAESGEAEFRRFETEALARALEANGAVIATGGGIVEEPANRPLLGSAAVVWLTAKPETLVARLGAHGNRPLLAGDPLAALHGQIARRTQHYAALADWVVSTDQLTPEEVAGQIRRFVDIYHHPATGQLIVNTPGGRYEVIVGEDALGSLPQRLSASGPTGRLWVVSDDQVWQHHGRRLLAVLEGAGLDVSSFQIPAGEASKNLQVVSNVYDWMLRNKVERHDMLIAFGGGVVGDLAGYVASTILRGIGLVQLPTTVLAMVDSSIGGKTGVDHAAGKNLIGAFYQPRLVVADTSVLATLSLPERQAGWAEAIKHGVIADRQLFDDLVSSASQLAAVREPATSDLIRRAAAVKVGVVSGDEREQGRRMLLNYGHTIGHAVERWSNYTIRHGEGVAMGMAVAADIARRMGICDGSLIPRQREALEAFGLPIGLPAGVAASALLKATRSDKKVRQKRINWVLPQTIGAAMVRGDVPDEIVLAALAAAGAS